MVESSEKMIKVAKDEESDDTTVPGGLSRTYEDQKCEAKPHAQPIYVDSHQAYCPETCHRICDARRGEAEWRAQGGWYEVSTDRTFKEKVLNIVDIRRPSPQPPQSRYSGYEPLENKSYSLPLRLVRALNADLVKVKHNQQWWLEDFTLPKGERLKWMDRLALSSDSAFRKHVGEIRNQAWQVSQELSIAGWWFLRNRLQLSPYYSQLIDAAREGASIADLGCGLGQDLRFLHDDGANGIMWAIDIEPKLWDLGNQLFADLPGPAKFIKADLVSGYGNPCGLHALHDKVDFFLLNDYLSFLGSEVIRRSLNSIVYASKPSSKIIGWTFGNDRVENVMESNGEFCSPEIWGDGFRGVIHHPVAFRQQTWKRLEDDTGTQWNLELQLLEPEEFGFDTDELKLIWKQHQLKVLCFMATRLS